MDRTTFAVTTTWHRSGTQLILAQDRIRLKPQAQKRGRGYPAGSSGIPRVEPGDTRATPPLTAAGLVEATENRGQWGRGTGTARRVSPIVVALMSLIKQGIFQAYPKGVKYCHGWTGPDQSSAPQGSDKADLAGGSVQRTLTVFCKRGTMDVSEYRQQTCVACHHDLLLGSMRVDLV